MILKIVFNFNKNCHIVMAHLSNFMAYQWAVTHPLGNIGLMHEII